MGLLCFRHLLILLSLLGCVCNGGNSHEDVLALVGSQLTPVVSNSTSTATNTPPLEDTFTITSSSLPVWLYEVSSSPEAHGVSCTTKWPDLEIFLPVYLNGNVSTDPDGVARVHGDVTQKFERNDEWTNVFLRSFLMFWPVKESKVKFRVILDEELRNSSLVKEHITNFIDKKSIELGEDFPSINITYNPPLKNVYTTGHDRQQYLMFTADKITSSEFVAFADTDTLFHSYADVNDMFEDGKPIIHGKIQYFGGNTVYFVMFISFYHLILQIELVRWENYKKELGSKHISFSR